MTYQIILSPEAKKNLRRIKDRRLHDRIIAVVAALAADPRPVGCLKLVGEADQWRVRVGDWRVAYRIDGEEGSGLGPIHGSGGAMEPTDARSASGGPRVVVVVVRVAPRSGVYG
jgi:mRNA interferase RelE/StbE